MTKATYKDRALAELAEWELLQVLTQRRRIWRFQSAVEALMTQGRGAVVCPARIASCHVEGQWMIVDVDSWRELPWYAKWLPNKNLGPEVKYIFIKFNQSYTGENSLRHFQIFKPSLPTYGLWYLTPAEFHILGELMWYPEYTWMQEQVSLDAEGQPNGEMYQCSRYGLEKGPIVRAKFQHGWITWGDSDCVNCYFGKLMYLDIEKSAAFYEYYKKTYGNTPEMPYSFDKEGIPHPKYYSGLFWSDIPQHKKYLKLTGAGMESLEARKALLEMRYC